ncbi:response regulator transcription factor, partial [bacterium]|nr:response regulator transcription factor [bacterium]
MKKILIAEDDPKISRILELELSHEGYKTCIVDDGYDALIKFEDFKPDIVVLDILLPGLNGKEVAKRLRDRDANVGIIMLTALGDIKDKLEAFKYGADDYIVKPFSIEELIARIEAIYRRKESTRQVSVKIFGIELL